MDERSEIISRHLDAMNEELHNKGHRIVALAPAFLAKPHFAEMRKLLEGADIGDCPTDL